MKAHKDSECQKNHPENCLIENIEKIKDLLAEPILGTSKTSQQTQEARLKRQQRQQTLNNQVRECRLNEQANEHEIDECKQHSATLVKESKALQIALHNEHQKAAAMHTEMQRLAAQNNNLQEHIDKLIREHQAIRLVEKSGHQSTLRISRQEEQKSKMQSQLKSQQVQAEKKLLAKQNLALEQTIQHHEGIIKQQKIDLDKVRVELADNKRNLAELTEHVAELHEELSKLTTQKHDLLDQLYKHEETKQQVQRKNSQQKQRLILNHQQKQQVANVKLAAFEQHANQIAGHLAQERIRAFLVNHGFPVEQIDLSGI